MAAHPGITDEQRAAIADDIRTTAGTATGSVRAIAARHGVGKSTVHRIAEQFGLTDAWADGTAQTEQATATRAAIVAAKRAALQERLLDTANELLDDLDEPVTVALSTVMGVERVTLPPGPRERKDQMQAVASAAAQSVALARLDADTAGAGAASGLLDQFEDALRGARHDREAAAEDGSA